MWHTQVGTRRTSQSPSSQMLPEDKLLRWKILNIIDSDSCIQMSRASCSSSDKLTLLQDRTVSHSHTQILTSDVSRVVLGSVWLISQQNTEFWCQQRFQTCGSPPCSRLMLMSGDREKASAGGDEAEAAVWRDEWSGSTAPTRRVRRPVIPPAPRETRETRFWPEEHTLKSHLLDLTSVSLIQWKKQFHFYTGTVLTRVLLLYLKYFWYFTVDPEVLLISDTYSSTIHMSDFHYSNSNILTTYLDF